MKQTTTKLAKASKPKPLTRTEREMVEKEFFLPGWQFDQIIKKNCVKIDTVFIGISHDFGDEPLRLHAEIYGLIGVNTDTKEQVIVNFFIRDRSSVYQVQSLWEVKRLTDALARDNKVYDYNIQHWSKK